MKILQIISSVDPASGGPIEGTKQFASAANTLGHEVEIVTLDAPDNRHISGVPAKTYALGPSIFNYRYSRRLVPWLKTHARLFDAVIVRGIWQYAGFGTWRALSKSRIPYFVFLHGMLEPWFKRAYPLKHLKKRLYWPWAEYRVLRDARAVIFTSEEERLLAHRSFWPYKSNEAVVTYGTALPQGDAESQREVFLKAFPELRDKRILLFLGRIHPIKGCDLLIEAFSQVSDKDPSMHLVIAGPDEVKWQAKLRRDSRKKGIEDRITWTGMLIGDSKWGALHASEVFVLPSRQESFGIAMVEALACGVPALLSNKVNIWQAIEAGRAGFIANDDVDGIKQLLERWIVLPDDERDMMKKRAKELFIKRFEIHKAALSLIDTLQTNGVKA